jgi:predicted porin
MEVRIKALGNQSCCQGAPGGCLGGPFLNMEIHMKKSLLALAVLGAFAGAASAQSSVTMYGIFDVNYQVNDPKAAGASSTSGINSGHQFGSRFGVRGAEDLGGGLAAIFTLENGFSGDTGQLGQGGRLFGRQAWAGVRSNSFGSIVAGRVAIFGSGTGSFDMFGTTDPFGTGFGISSLASTFSSANALRVDNAVLWQSQAMSGFRAGVGYSFNINGSEAAGSGANTRMVFTGLNYSAGPIFASVTYDQVKSPGAPDTQTHLQLGGVFDLKFMKLHAGYAKEDNQRVGSTVGTTNGADASAYMVGATVPVGKSLLLLGSYQNRNGKAVGTYEADRTVWGIGAIYSLSNRSALYANYGSSDGKKSLNNNAAYDTTQLTVGMSHRF